VDGNLCFTLALVAMFGLAVVLSPPQDRRQLLPTACRALCVLALGGWALARADPQQIAQVIHDLAPVFLRR
jgi:hypothetical protein